MGISFLAAVDTELLHMFNNSNSLFLDSMAQILTSGFTWAALYIALIFLIIKNNETMVQIWLAIGCAVLCVMLAGGVDDLIVKPLAGRLRPTYDPAVKYTLHIVDGIYGGGKYSFFSAHAANTFSLALFLCYMVRSKALGVALVTWSAVNCWTRLYLGVHYPSDILVGLAWGAVVATLVYLLYRHLYRKLSPNQNYISTQFTSTGYSRSDINWVLSVLMLIYIYILCRSVAAIYQ